MKSAEIPAVFDGSSNTSCHLSVYKNFRFHSSCINSTAFSVMSADHLEFQPLLVENMPADLHAGQTFNRRSEIYAASDVCIAGHRFVCCLITCRRRAVVCECNRQMSVQNRCKLLILVNYAGYCVRIDRAQHTVDDYRPDRRGRTSCPWEQAS